MQEHFPGKLDKAHEKTRKKRESKLCSVNEFYTCCPQVFYKKAHRKTPVSKSLFNTLQPYYLQALLKADSPQVFFKTCFVTAPLEKLQKVVVKIVKIKNNLRNL